MSELFRVLVTRPDGKNVLATNRKSGNKYEGSKYFTRKAAEQYVEAAERLAAERGSDQTFKVLADGEGFYTL